MRGGLIGRAAVLLKGVVVRGNPNVGLVAKTEANRRGPHLGGVFRRRNHRCHNVCQSVGQAKLETLPEVLRRSVMGLMEEVTIYGVRI